MFLDHRYFDENASQSRLGRAVSCLSGRTAVYRRHVLLEIEREFMNETFWGVPALSGDDKRLTTLTLERGYRTYLQRSAEVWSTFPTTWRVFVRQRLRWARNTWRSDLRALSKGWVWRHPFLAYTMVDKGVSSFTLLVGPAFLVYSLIQQNWIFCLVLVAWWQLSRAAKLLPHIRQRPSSFFVVLGYVVVSWVMALIKIYALLTIRKQRWLTRQVAVENGEVVRTADATHDTAEVPADAPRGVPAVGTPDETSAPVPAAGGSGRPRMAA
jgi:cellulose synthase/poly-beta-1,6-N-acetylglucosamine synthase-like glycosyltransferase